LRWKAFALNYREVLYETLGYVLEKLNHKASPLNPHPPLTLTVTVGGYHQPPAPVNNAADVPGLATPQADVPEKLRLFCSHAFVILYFKIPKFQVSSLQCNCLTTV